MVCFKPKISEGTSYYLFNISFERDRVIVSKLTKNGLLEFDANGARK